MKIRVAALLCLALVGCGGPEPSGDGAQERPPDRVDVRFGTAEGQAVIRAEVADDASERARGLMGRRSLDRNEGMLFLFAEPSEHRFWMKDTSIALDLISIRAGRVVAVDRLVPCHQDPCPTTLTPKIDAALEVAAGTAAREGITPGTPVGAGGLL